jgi:hypothetical protein
MNGWLRFETDFDTVSYIHAATSLHCTNILLFVTHFTGKKGVRLYEIEAEFGPNYFSVFSPK